jgi:DNA-binding response OmpR family regulator
MVAPRCAPAHPGVGRRSVSATQLCATVGTPLARRIAQGENMQPNLDPARAPSVLLIGADEWLARSIESLLAGEGYTVAREHALRHALAGLQRHTPDAVVLSLDLRHPDAPALCKSLREDAYLSPATPIFVTAPAAPTRQERLAALRAGATEVMTQPLDTEEFLLRLTAHLRIKRDMDRARESRMLDPATGLYSPLGLSQRQQEFTAHAARTSVAVACVVIAVQPSSEGVRDDIGRTLHRMGAASGRGEPWPSVTDEAGKRTHRTCSPRPRLR